MSNESTPEPQTDETQDIFSRPKSYRVNTVLEVWERAERVPGKPNHRYDWRNGTLIGPWKPGELRDGIWDMGHIEPWYRVVERLKKVEGITREQVIDEFNNVDNIGVEDPETNRKLGINSRRMGVDRLPYATEEELLFENTAPETRDTLRGAFHGHIREKSRSVDERLMRHNTKGSNMQELHSKTAKDTAIDVPGRVIVWDTETTGLHATGGDKIIEIGAIEMIDGEPTGKTYHQYINPERSIPRAATNVHGITDDDVKDKPVFKDIAQDFLDFIGDAPLVAHNANFDMRFINAELEAAGREPINDARKIDTLRMARNVLPELGKYDLDTIAEHFGVDASGREEFHGALVDTLILAEVYQNLAELAKEQGVPFFDASKAAARMAPAAQEQVYAEAVATEQQFQQAQQAKRGHSEQGFADRVRGGDAPQRGSHAEAVRQSQASQSGIAR